MAVQPDLFPIEEAEPQKPRFIAPHVKTYQPTMGEFITRPIGVGSTIQTSYDPGALRSGYDSMKYGAVAIHPSAQPAVKFMAEGPFWSEWHFHDVNDYEQYPEYEDIDRRVQYLINYQIDSMQYETFENTLKGIWRDSFVYGFSVSELNYVFDGTYTIIESIKTHSPFNFEFYTDQGNNLTRVYYRLTGTYIEEQTLPKLLITTYPYLEHGKFYGTSMLQSVYFDIKLIEILEQALAEATRRLAVRPIVHHFSGQDMSDDDVATVRNNLYQLDSGSLISFPAIQGEDGTLKPQHDIKVLEDRASPEGTALILQDLDILYKRVNRSLGLPDDLGFSSTTIGSFAKAQEEMNLYTQSIVNNQNFIEGFVNRKLIPAMIRYNYPSLLNERTYKLPEFCFGSVEEDFDTIKSNNMIELVEAGILSVEHDLPYMREQLKLPAAPQALLEKPVNAIESAPAEQSSQEEAPVENMDAYEAADYEDEYADESDPREERLMKRLGRKVKQYFS